jgi:hypothetical protein
MFQASLVCFSEGYQAERQIITWDSLHVVISRCAKKIALAYVAYISKLYYYLKALQ